MGQKYWFGITLTLSVALVAAILLLTLWSPVSVTSSKAASFDPGTQRLSSSGSNQQALLTPESPGQEGVPPPTIAVAVAPSQMEQSPFPLNGGSKGNSGPSSGPAHPSVEDLIQATKSPDWATRWDAVNALGKLKDPLGIPALVTRALHDDNTHPRWRSLWALSALDRGGSNVIPLLRVGLEDPDPLVVRNAAVALAFFSHPDSRLELLRGSNDPDPFRRWEAIFILKNVGGPEVVQKLIPLLNREIEPETMVRQAVALTLGRIGGEQAAPALLDALREDPSPQVRWRIAMSLSMLGDASLVSELDQALSTEVDPQVRGHIEDAITKLQKS